MNPKAYRIVTNSALLLGIGAVFALDFLPEATWAFTLVIVASGAVATGTYIKRSISLTQQQDRATAEAVELNLPVPYQVDDAHIPARIRDELGAGLELPDEREMGAAVDEAVRVLSAAMNQLEGPPEMGEGLEEMHSGMAFVQRRGVDEDDEVRVYLGTEKPTQRPLFQTLRTPRRFELRFSPSTGNVHLVPVVDDTPWARFFEEQDEEVDAEDPWEWAFHRTRGRTA